MSMETLCWIPVGESFKKAYLEEWDFLRATTLPTNKELRISLCSYTALATQITYAIMILQHLDHRGSPILFPGNLLGPG